MWWLGDELYVGWGRKGHWIVGASWATWLMFLSVHKTGDGMLQSLTNRYFQILKPKVYFSRILVLFKLTNMWLIWRAPFFENFVNTQETCVAIVLLRIVFTVQFYLGH